MEPIDSALMAFQSIQQEIKGYDATIFSEQDSRVKIIDRILIEVLGYDYSDIFTEPSSGTGFIDYKISIKDIGRLVIEAKRDGNEFKIDSTYSGRGYNLDGAIFNNKDLKEGISQTIYYAAQESIELGCLTNGKTWIIFRANRMGDGKKVIKGKGIVFTSLELIEKNFKLFYELLSQHSLKNFMYRAIFQELEGQEIRTKDFIKSLKNENTVSLLNSNYSLDFDRVMTTFFSKLAGEDDPDMLMQCFIESKESKDAEIRLTRVSNDLIAKIRTIETHEAEIIQKVIERIKQTSRQDFIILVGSKGAGKSTFVDRFFKYVLTSTLREECVIIKINVGKYKGSNSEIVEWLDTTLLEVCETVLYDGYPSNDEIQGIFFGEYCRLRSGPWKILYEKDKEQFKIDFGKHIESRRETRPTEYIQKLIGNVVKSRRKIPCIIFDNADHFSIDIQEKVFQYGRSIYENELCLVIVPITDKTSWQLSKQGAIRSYENEVLFLPTPSPKKVIERRIEYLDEKVNYEKQNKAKYFLKKGIQIELQNIEAFVRFLQLVFIQDTLVSKWIATLSNYDIRVSLEITKDLISSPHLTLDDFLKLYVEKQGAIAKDEFSVKPYLIKRAIIKRSYHSYPVNHHPFVQNLFYCTGNMNTSPVLSLRILQLLIDRKGDRGREDDFLEVSQIQDYFIAMGIDRQVIQKHLQTLLSKGLLRSYDPSIEDIDYSKSLEITPSGSEHYYWSVNDIDYIYMMLEVTPLTDQNLFQYISENYYIYHQKFTVINRFLDYLEKEDKLYCKIPPHISYKGQHIIFTRFDWQRQILNRKK